MTGGAAGPEDEGWKIELGPNGTARAVLAGSTRELQVVLQLAPDRNGRLRTHTVLMKSDKPITARTWREVPIDEIERLVARDAAAEVLPITQIIRPARGITDEFLRDVAGVYQHLVTARQRPGPTMARDADVSIPTAYRWVAMARGRGLLPPARHGIAG